MKKHSMKGLIGLVVALVGLSATPAEAAHWAHWNEGSNIQLIFTNSNDIKVEFESAVLNADAGHCPSDAGVVFHLPDGQASAAYKTLLATLMTAKALKSTVGYGITTTCEGNGMRQADSPFVYILQ